jgi:uncharacterized delta-60 repeat protein
MVRKFLIAVTSVVILDGTLSFSQGVDTSWVRRYNGPNNNQDVPSAIVVDAAGNVYVTGRSTGIDTDFDYATLKYDSLGNELWTKRYNGLGNGPDESGAIAVDYAGNVYVSGGSLGIGVDYDYATIKYYSNGDTVWVRRYDGPIGSVDGVWAMALDSFGNVYVTGQSYGSATGFDYATIKYCANGDTAWVRRYDGPSSNHDYAYAMALDSGGVLYVTGASYGNGTGLDFVTIKYDSSGNELWIGRYNGTGNGHDCAKDITVDGLGNIYVTGYSFGNGTSDDFVTIKYYPSGDTGWVRRYNAPADSTDRACAIAVDGLGNVYVAGTSFSHESNGDYVTIKYYPNGDTAWVRRYNGPGNSNDAIAGIALDDSGCVYVTGESLSNRGDYDCTTIKYSPNGAVAWVRRYNGPESLNDVGWAITVDSFGNVYVTGSSTSSVTGDDYVTIKYSPYLCGDINGDQQGPNVADLTYLVDYLFRGGTPPPVMEAANVDSDNGINVADLTYLVDYLFRGGAVPMCAPIEKVYM